MLFLPLIQFPPGCLLWSTSHLETITFFSCLAPYRWMEQFKPCWPRLKHLYLPYTTKTSDHDLKYLASLKSTALMYILNPTFPLAVYWQCVSIYPQPPESKELLSCRGGRNTDPLWILSGFGHIRRFSLQGPYTTVLTSHSWAHDWVRATQHIQQCSHGFGGESWWVSVPTASQLYSLKATMCVPRTIVVGQW